MADDARDGPPTSAATIRGLALACHPAPTVAVTTIATVLFVVVGNQASTCVVGAAAVFTGQLSIGWSNDVVDAARDARTGRSDKPIAAGLVGPATVRLAALVALVSTVPLSLALGWRAGLVHLLGVACGWGYNLGLKSTTASPLPYLVAFGTLPAVATLALGPHPWPPWWAMVAAGLIGVAAHFANVLPDLADDARTGVRGLPHRFGALTTILGAAAIGVVATVLVLAGSPRSWWLTSGALLVVLVLSCAGVLTVRRQPGSEAAFYVIVAVAAVNVALLASSAHLT